MERLITQLYDCMGRGEARKRALESLSLSTKLMVTGFRGWEGKWAPSQWLQRPVVGADTPRIQIQYLQSGKTPEKLRDPSY